MTYAGLAIATTDNRHSLPDYPNKTTEGYDEEYEDERASVDFNRFLIVFCTSMFTVLYIWRNDMRPPMSDRTFSHQ